jgi:hypothetical protein
MRRNEALDWLVRADSRAAIGRIGRVNVSKTPLPVFMLAIHRETVADCRKFLSSGRFLRRCSRNAPLSAANRHIRCFR